jgi:CRP/FNR family transcriptional regulator, cyclic AMP receptor protein
MPTGKASNPKQQDLFSSLAASEQRTLLAKCKELHFEESGHLFSQNEPYTASHIVMRGIVRTYYVSPTGKEITIAYWSEGAFVGGPNVFNQNGTHIWAAQAVTDVLTLAIRGDDLEQLSRRIPALAHYLIETLTFKLHWVSVLLQTFGTESIRSRLAHLILHLGERYGVPHADGQLIQHHFSHDELARMVGATRPWVTIAIRNFKKDGLLSCSGRHLVIVDRQGLENAIHPDRPRVKRQRLRSHGVRTRPSARMISHET